MIFPGAFDIGAHPVSPAAVRAVFDSAPRSVDETAKLQTVTRYLRRTYGGATPNLNGLKALVEKVASNGALACVTITGDSFEGSSNHGEITLQPLLYLKAALDLLDELDPADPSAEPARGALVDFSTTTVGT